MKNIVLVMISSILGVLTLAIIMTVYGRMNRSMELKSNLSSVVEETVENIFLNPKYKVSNTNELLADFVESLSVAMDSQSDIKVEVFQVDKEKGVLDVKVTADYLHPSGEEGTVADERMVLVNRLQEETSEQYTVKFYVGEEAYKIYTVFENSIIFAPAEPQETGKVFYGWLDENGVPADFTKPVTMDLKYYADFR